MTFGRICEHIHIIGSVSCFRHQRHRIWAHLKRFTLQYGRETLSLSRSRRLSSCERKRTTWNVREWENHMFEMQLPCATHFNISRSEWVDNFLPFVAFLCRIMWLMRMDNSIINLHSQVQCRGQMDWGTAATASRPIETRNWGQQRQIIADNCRLWSECSEKSLQCIAWIEIWWRDNRSESLVGRLGRSISRWHNDNRPHNSSRPSDLGAEESLHESTARLDSSLDAGVSRQHQAGRDWHTAEGSTVEFTTRLPTDFGHWHRLVLERRGM